MGRQGLRSDWEEARGSDNFSEWREKSQKGRLGLMRLGGSKERRGNGNEMMMVQVESGGGGGDERGRGKSCERVRRHASE